MAILGIAGTVGVFVAMLSLARGFRATLVASGSPDDALVMRAGSTSEMMGGITLDSVKLVQDKPGVARDASGQPLVTQEVVGVIPIPLISTGTDANVEVRGVSPNVLRNPQIREDRSGADVPFRPGRARRRQERLENLRGPDRRQHGRTSAAGTGRWWECSTRADRRSIPKCGATRAS